MDSLAVFTYGERHEREVGEACLVHLATISVLGMYQVRGSSCDVANSQRGRLRFARHPHHARQTLDRKIFSTLPGDNIA